MKHFMAGQCSHEELLSLKPKAHTSYRSSRRNCLTGGFPVPERGTGNPPHPLSWTVRPLHKKVSRRAIYNRQVIPFLQVNMAGYKLVQGLGSETTIAKYTLYVNVFFFSCRL